MSAKDYHICPALFNAYIAKISKRNPNLMLNDRRVISNQEILNLLIWYIKRECGKNHGIDLYITENGNEILYIQPKGRILEEIKEELK